MSILNKIVNKFTVFHRRFLWKKNFIFYFSSNLNIKNLNNIRNLYHGRRCFIMGNGPSLLKSDLSKLKNEITIASNANFLIWDQMGFTPTFLTVEDRLVAEDRAGDLMNIKSTTKIFPLDLLYCLKPDEHSIFIKFDRKYINFPQFSEDFSRIVYWGGTVSYLNIQLAYYLGCKEIYLIGFDHSYKVPDKNKIKKFVITSEGDDENHIHPNYFGKGYRWHDPMLWRMELAYERAKIFLEKRNVSIHNATEGGKLEIFNRIKFEDVIINRKA